MSALADEKYAPVSERIRDQHPRRPRVVGQHMVVDGPAPTTALISSDACAVPYSASMPGKMAHHVPARSSLPTRPGAAPPSTQY